MSLFDFLTSRKEFNVYQHDIHIFMNMIMTIDDLHSDLIR
jgi:hypothetical protein